ncbi:MAG: biotin--[acetyl-CoA-carboxylase] ligase [Alphaproteobacteria bacterium]|nr:biotin--[acetyl-CoA-carboxylase] ligase [Alphaproteobacteria bacterium]
MIGFRIIDLETIDSTNLELRRLFLAHKVGHGTVLMAKTQTQGRGRLNRQWQSAAGNLFASLLIEPPDHLKDLSSLNAFAAGIIRKSLLEIIDDTQAITIKWPNDVLLYGRKVAGILAESLLNARSAKPAVIVGIGINIDHSPQQTLYPATSINDHLNDKTTREVVLESLLRAWDRDYHRWCENTETTLQEVWLPYMEGKGQMRRVNRGNTAIEGRVVDFYADGTAVLQPDHGDSIVIRVGDVS